MHTLFLLNPAAGKVDCTRTLPQQIAAAAAGAGLAPEDYTIRVTTHAGHARELSRAAAAICCGRVRVQSAFPAVGLRRNSVCIGVLRVVTLFPL